MLLMVVVCLVYFEVKCILINVVVALKECIK